MLIKSKNDGHELIKLSNGQWLRIHYHYNKKDKCWMMMIVVENSKRQCNDCIKKTAKSPKVIYGKSTGQKLGLEPFSHALKSLCEFEKLIPKSAIRITPSNERLFKLYGRLKRYGFEEIMVKYRNEDKKAYYKVVS